MKKFKLITLLIFSASLISAQEVINLYTGTVPGSKVSDIKETGANTGSIANVTVPTLEIFLPEKDVTTGEIGRAHV